MTKWKNNNVDIGKVKENSKTILKFETKEELKIKEVKPGCGSCTTIKGVTPTELIVEYKAGTIPTHLTKLGTKELFITKNILVSYEDGSLEKLYFKGWLVK